MVSSPGSSSSRRNRAWAAARLVGVAVVLAGCAHDAGSGARAPDDGHCSATATASAAGSAARAIASAGPGDVICLEAGSYGSRPIVVARSGTAAAPIEIRASGEATVGGFRVQADHVTIRGFEVTPGPSDRRGVAPGISLAGTGLVVTANLYVPARPPAGRAL